MLEESLRLEEDFYLPPLLLFRFLPLPIVFLLLPIVFLPLPIVNLVYLPSIGADVVSEKMAGFLESVVLLSLLASLIELGT